MAVQMSREKRRELADEPEAEPVSARIIPLHAEPRTAILPLTSNPTTVINTINSMQAEGGTNIHYLEHWLEQRKR